jgi:excisionase family DNA binding protein
VNPSTLPYLLTVDEAAELLRATKAAVYARIERGLLPSVVRDGAATNWSPTGNFVHSDTGRRS